MEWSSRKHVLGESTTIGFMSQDLIFALDRSTMERMIIRLIARLIDGMIPNNAYIYIYFVSEGSSSNGQTSNVLSS